MQTIYLKSPMKEEFKKYIKKEEYNPDIKTITCTISIPPLDEATILDEDTFLDDATVSSTKYYREADIKALIANPNRLTIVRNDITTTLKELNSSYSFTR